MRVLPFTEPGAIEELTYVKAGSSVKVSCALVLPQALLNASNRKAEVNPGRSGSAINCVFKSYCVAEAGPLIKTEALLEHKFESIAVTVYMPGLLMFAIAVLAGGVVFHT